MTLRIEEGKFYKTRDGRKVGPIRMYAPPHRTEFKWAGTECGRNYTMLWKDDGENFYGWGSAKCLVAEWVDEPAPALSASLLGQVEVKREPVTKKTVLETAQQTVADRGVPYGGVEDNFNRIARLWNAHLFNRFDVNEGGMVEIAALGAEDVAMMMALMKIARLQANPSHADSWVDVAGYAACGGEIGAKMAVDKPSEM